MNFKLSTTELEILEIFANHGGYAKTAHLVSFFQGKYPGTPKQTIYRCISSLKQKEVVIVTKGTTSINTHWLGIWRHKLDQLESYSLGQDIPNKLSYVFPSFLSLTPIWTHYVNILTTKSDMSQPIIFINPHQWFFVIREWSENQLVNKLESDGYTLWQGITHISPVDRLMLRNKFTGRKNVSGSFITARTGEEDTYINIIGDYIIKVTTNVEFAYIINTWYTNTKEITPESILELEKLIGNSGPVKMIVAKNKSKVSIYRNLMKKFIV